MLDLILFFPLLFCFGLLGRASVQLFVGWRRYRLFRKTFELETRSR